MKLTIKQKKFADEYIICGNATEAAVRAGYSPKTAHQIGHANLNKPHIKTYIEKRLQEIASKKIADQQEIMEYLTSVMRGERKEEVLKGVGDGVQEIVEIAVSEKDKIKAAELIGKRYGLWTDKVDMDTNINIVIEDDYGD